MSTIGIVGYGKMGQIRAQTIEEQGKKVLGVYEPLGPIGKHARFTTPEDLISVSDIVFVCTPNKYNRPLVIKCLEQNKHVFCEKPPAFTAEEVISIREVEKRSTAVLMYGFNHRHHESIKKIKELVDTQQFGKILWMRGRYGKTVDKDFLTTWRADKQQAGGGILLDQGIHMLDLLSHLGGPYDKVQSTVSNQFWKLDGIEDNVFAILENTENNVVAQLHSTMTQWRHLFSLEIFLERGYMTLNGLLTTSGAYGDEILTVAEMADPVTSSRIVEENYAFKVNTSWKSEVAHFFDIIDHQATPEYGTSEDALEVMRLIDTIYSNGK